jgi:tetratricopeptide (TPR) repeat protein
VSLSGRKKEQKPQEKPQSTSQIASNENKQDQIVKELLTDNSPTLEGLIKVLFKKIIDSKEFPSLGHAIGSVKKELQKNLHPIALRAYDHGYFHLLPMFMDIDVGIDKLGIYELGLDGKVHYQNYAKPGIFLFYELMHPDKAPFLYEHDPGQCSREELVQELYFFETAIKEVFPNIIIHALYPNLVYFILEFKDPGTAFKFIIQTRLFWTSFIIKDLHYPSAAKFLKNDNGLLVLDLPMKGSGEKNRVWWQQGNTVLSICSEGKGGENEIAERKTSIGLCLRALNDNEKYLTQATSTQSNTEETTRVESETKASTSAVSNQKQAESGAEDSIDEGVKLFQNKRYEEALQVFTRTIQNEPNNGTAYRWSGRMKMQMRNFVLAEKDLKKAIELNPDDEEA